MIPYVQLVIKDNVSVTENGKVYSAPVVSGFRVAFINPNMYRRFESNTIPAVVKEDPDGSFAEQDLQVGLNKIIRLEAVQPTQNDRDPTDVVHMTEQQLAALAEILGPPQDNNYEEGEIIPG